MGKAVMSSSVSLDGFVADENDQPGPLFDWLTSWTIPKWRSRGTEFFTGAIGCVV